jgi:hypothetical protein
MDRRAAIDRAPHRLQQTARGHRRKLPPEHPRRQRSEQNAAGQDTANDARARWQLSDTQNFFHPDVVRTFRSALPASLKACTTPVRKTL